MAIRLNRYLAEAGFGSRRGVESLIRDGRVRINGETVTSLGARVDVQRDRVEVDGAPVQGGTSKRIILYNKPAGVICSFRRQGRSKCLADVLGGALRAGRLFHFGRLDKDTTGLLLLGDDGELAHALTHPSRELWKRYRVRVDAPLEEGQLTQIRDGGLELDGETCLPARIRPGKKSSTGVEYQMELREGKNRQIRRIFELFGRKIHSLHRASFGPLTLEGLEVGSWRELRTDELQALREAAGLTHR